MFKEVSPGVFAFVSSNEGSNVFLLRGEKETALIDSSIEENKEAVISGLESLGLKPGDISLILHTHGHADHFGLDYLFKKARIAMHKEDGFKINENFSEFACVQFFPGTKMPKVVLFLEPEQEVDFGNFKLRLVHTPGHTGGSVCFFLEKKGLLFSGDTLFSHGFGRTDLVGGSSQKMLKSLKTLEKLPIKVLLPGHGYLLQGEEQIAYSLKETIATAHTNTFL